MSDKPLSLVSKDPSTGRIWVATVELSVVRSPGGVWERDAPSPDDLKDNFERVTDSKAATALLNEALAAASSNPSLLRAASQAA